MTAYKQFLSRHGAKYPKATEKSERHREALFAFFSFPAEHWMHLRTANPIESTVATVRYRTTLTKKCVSRTTFLGLAFKLTEEAAKSWGRIRPPKKVGRLLEGKCYKDGIPGPDDPAEKQRGAA